MVDRVLDAKNTLSIFPQKFHFLISSSLLVDLTWDLVIPYSFNERYLVKLDSFHETMEIVAGAHLLYYHC